MRFESKRGPKKIKENKIFCNLENLVFLFFLFFFLLFFHYSFSFALQRWLYNIFNNYDYLMKKYNFNIII